MGAGGPALLEARGLVKHFPAGGRGLFARAAGTVRAVDGVSFRLAPGETLALVGESGCGKTTLARTVSLLYPPSAGRVRFEGEDITDAKGAALKRLRRRVQMIFQDPYGSLNPRLPVGAIIAEPLVIHAVGDRRRRRERVADLIGQVGLRSEDMDRYPHQFSGGQRQRIAIARALALRPRLVIADEPLSALDVSIQSQVLNLMKDLQEAHGLTYLFISHDLSVVRHVADRVAVMYLGRIVEEAETARLFADARHPYSQALLAARPVLGRGKRARRKVITGDVPSPLQAPAGCAFHTRCPMAAERCRSVAPALEDVAGRDGHRAACHFKEET